MSQHVIPNGGETREPEPSKHHWPVKQAIGYLASLTCLAGAGYLMLTTRDVLAFLLLIGVATGQIPIWKAIRHLGHPSHSEADNKEQ